MRFRQKPRGLAKWDQNYANKKPRGFKELKHEVPRGLRLKYHQNYGFRLALSRSASGTGSLWVEALVTLKNIGCFQCFFLLKASQGLRRFCNCIDRERGTRQIWFSALWVKMYYVLNNCAGEGGNRNGFNMNRKLICEFFPPPEPQSHTNTYWFCLFFIPLLSRRTRRLSSQWAL